MDKRLKPVFKDSNLYSIYKENASIISLMRALYETTNYNTKDGKDKIIIGFILLGLVNAISEKYILTPKEHLHLWRAISTNFEIPDKISDKVHTYASSSCWDMSACHNILNVQQPIDSEPLRELVALGENAYNNFLDGKTSVILGASLTVESHLKNEKIPSNIDNL